MLKIFTSILLITSTFSIKAQIGATAPDFTVTDINGNQHNLYTYLNSGKVVLLDVSATWCGPCWGFHSAHFLEDLYAEFGPNGTNEVVVLFYEGDPNTDVADLNGSTAASQGDWVTGTPYPIINESPIQLNLNVYAPLGFPTINVLCPSDKKIKWDLWDSVANDDATSLANMRSKVQEYIDACAISAGTAELEGIEVAVTPNPAGETLQLSFKSLSEETQVHVFDVAGKQVLVHTVQSGVNEAALNLTELESGVYFVQLQSLNKQSESIRFIKN